MIIKNYEVHEKDNMQVNDNNFALYIITNLVTS